MQKFSKKQKKVVTWWANDDEHDGIIVDGSIRAGKTVSMICGFLLWSQAKFSHCDFIIAGRTISSLKRNVVNPMMGILTKDLKWNYAYNRSENYLTIGTNRYYMFGASSEQSQDVLQGMTAAGCFADEVALFPRSFVDQMTARCSVSGSKMWFNCNPSFPMHFFKTEWVDRHKEKKLIYLHFNLDDNLTLLPEIKERYHRMYHGVFYDRYILGKWVVADGLVYQYDSPDAYTCTHDEARGLRTVKRADGKEHTEEGQGMWYVSIDYGITNPFAAILWRVTPEKAYAVDLYYFDSKKEGRRRTDDEHYAAVEKLIDGREIEEIVIDPSSSSFKETIYRNGNYAVKNAKNDVVNGISTTDGMLDDGTIKISKTCHELIAEMSQYRWDDKKERDEVIKENDHACDAMRYFAYTIMKKLLRYREG